MGIKKNNKPALSQAEQDQIAVEQQAATEANLALASSRRRRRMGSLLGAGRSVLGAPAGGGSPSGGGTALAGGSARSAGGYDNVGRMPPKMMA